MKVLSISNPCSQAYVAGTLHGDAWCSPLTLGLRCKDRDFADAFAIALTEVISEPTIPRLDERGYWLIRKGNKTGRFNHLRGYEPLLTEEIGFWLRGLFDSEGNAQCLPRPKIGPAAFHRRIAIYSTARTTIDRGEAYLTAIGIKAAVRATRNSAGHKGTKVVFELFVRSGRDNYRQFEASVGSSIARKRAAISNIISSYADDLSAHYRAGQLKGAAEKHRRTMSITLPAVARLVRELMDAGIKPTQRNCRTIPGYNSVQKYVPQSELVALALGIE